MVFRVIFLCRPFYLSLSYPPSYLRCIRLLRVSWLDLILLHRTLASERECLFIRRVYGNQE
jgi:hypothetical protein